MEIVEAKSSDVSQIAKMNMQLIQDEGHRNSMSLSQLTVRMNDWLSSEYTAVLFVNTEVLGYALWRTKNEYVYLRQFFVKRCFRRDGVGTEAYNLIESKYWNGSLVKLEVLSGNVVAQQFWQSLGFKQYCITMEKFS